MKSPLRRSARVAATATVLVVGMAATASALTIDSAGPLLEVTTTPDLNCAVKYDGDTYPSFYGTTACATIVATGGTLYSPASIPAGGSAEGTAWTPVSQTASGTGSESDPYAIVTVVTGGDLTVTQTDTYVVGSNAYRTSITVTNNGATALDAIVYHAADCYLQNSDNGFSEYDAATSAVTCRAPDAEGLQSEAGRVEQFVPLTAGSSYIGATYGTVWNAVGAMLPLPNTVRESAGTFDNGMGLSWSATLAQGESRTFALLTNFSPIGIVALPTALSADVSTMEVGDTATMTATITNPNSTPQDLAQVVITLPPGFDYVAGSSSSSEPTVGSGTLTFPGPHSIAGDAILTLTFQVEATAAGEDLEFSVDEGTTTAGAPLLASSTTLTVTQPAVEPTPEPTATPEPTVTPEPTATPEPTVAPEPTATPEPTVTPEPTNAPSASRSMPAAASDLPTTGSSATIPVLLAAMGACIAGAVILAVRRVIAGRHS